MMVVMAFKNPLMGLMATNSTFERFQSEGTAQKLLMVKALYVAMQILSLALGVWKVNQMGLLPYVLQPGYMKSMCRVCTNNDHRTTRSDWLAWESAREPLEYAIPAF